TPTSGPHAQGVSGQSGLAIANKGVTRADCCLWRRNKGLASLQVRRDHDLPRPPLLVLIAAPSSSRLSRHNLLDAVQRRLDANPQAMRQRRETVEHPFGTIKARMGATQFLMKTLPKVAAEMALSVLAYNLTRVMNI